MNDKTPSSPPTSPPPIWPALVFYDGACPVCSREMRHYCKRSDQDKLIFINIADPDFCAEDYGFRQDALMASLHVRLNDGTIRVGVDAFRVIWQATPRMGGLAWVAGLPVVHGALKVLYRCFAANRRFFRWPRSFR